MSAIEAILDRHERIALQFSGGKDSLACLYLMRPHWERLTVYWCDTGAAYPETVEIADKIAAMVPRFVRINGNQPQVIDQFGMPSDIVPVGATAFGQLVGSGVPLIQDRYSCCMRSIMAPTQARMVADGITLIIRGQKNADSLKPPVTSGTVIEGVEYLFPIEEWDDARVLAYLRDQDAPTPRFYEMLDAAPDCMTCTAWWEKSEGAYLKRYHFEHFKERQRRLELIQQAVSGHIAAFNQEIAL